MILGLKSSEMGISGNLIKIKLLQEVKAGGSQDVSYMSYRQVDRRGCFGCEGNMLRNCTEKINLQHVAKKGDASLSVVLSTHAMDKYKETDWFFDSACTSQITKYAKMIRNMQLIKNLSFSTANGREMEVKA